MTHIHQDGQTRRPKASVGSHVLLSAKRVQRHLHKKMSDDTGKPDIQKENTSSPPWQAFAALNGSSGGALVTTTTTTTTTTVPLVNAAEFR
jgi:hypothetical protein